jgi:hypothetical protein
MKTYKVLWIDDECKAEKSLAFITTAEQDGILITDYEVVEDGIKALSENLNDWDSVILDAKCFDKSTDETPDTIGLYNAIIEITKLSAKRPVPWFVLTGQPDRLSDAEFTKTLGGRIPYNKNIEADKEKLFNDIKTEADKSLETQIRHEHAGIFATNVDKAIVLNLLIALKTKDSKNPAHLNDIRKIMEDIFDECIAKGIISSSITKFNERSIALCDRSMQAIVPVYVQRNIHSVVEITQAGSHRTRIDSDIRTGLAPYLISSTILELLNIILWWDGYKKANP